MTLDGRVPLLKRMRGSSVLMMNLRGIASEACKNIVLAGVGSITILDPNYVSAEDLGAGFFFREHDIGQRVNTINDSCYDFIMLKINSQRVDVAKKRVNSLNPRVKVVGLTDDIESKVAEEGFLESFDIVCLTDSSSPVIVSKHLTYISRARNAIHNHH